MTIRLILSTIAVVCSLPGAAGAQTEVCDRNSGPESFEFEHYVAEQRPKEAGRFKQDSDRVSRQADRLRLKLDDGRMTELVDCPHGVAAHIYLYERYDDIGRFFVVRQPAFKDFSYTLVMSATGKAITVYGTPIWSPDKSRFLTVACSWYPPRGSLTLHMRANGGVTQEAEIALPTCLDESENCTARWDNPSWIAVSCVRMDGSSRKGSEFVVMRGHDGIWKTFGR